MKCENNWKLYGFPNSTKWCRKYSWGQYKNNFFLFAKNKFWLKFISIKSIKQYSLNVFFQTHRVYLNQRGKYDYSHRITLTRIMRNLDGFHQYDEDGFLIHRKLCWWKSVLVMSHIFFEKSLDMTYIIF